MNGKRKLCVCGRSEDQPWCDGSHVAEDWSCAAGADFHPLAFTATGRIANLARKLAAHYGAAHLRGESLRRGDTPAVGRLVVLADGSELLSDWNPLDSVDADSIIVFGLGPACAALTAAYPEVNTAIALDRSTLPIAFREVRRHLDHMDENSQSPDSDGSPLKSVFVSHAVADEPLLAPVVQALRNKLGVDVFVCGDSILPGSHWQKEIQVALEERDVFLLVLSSASLDSTFCAFEAGVATGLGKPIVLVSIDGTRPPAYIQHIHAFDLVRAQQTHPWLDEDDLLLEGLLTAVSGAPEQVG